MQFINNVSAHHSHPLIFEFGLHLSHIIIFTGLVVWDTRQPTVQIIIIIAVIVVCHLGSLQALRPETQHKNT